MTLHATSSSTNSVSAARCVALSPTLRAVAAAARAQGTRPSQQDEYVVLPCLPDRLAVAVFDGHGTQGDKVAAFARDALAHLLPPALAAAPSGDAPAVSSALRQVLDQIARGLAASENGTIIIGKEPPPDCHLSGTTALVVVFSAPTTIHVANIGDCAALFLQPNQVPLRLSRDHNCEDPDEAARVIAAGGRIARSDHNIEPPSHTISPFSTYTSSVTNVVNTTTTPSSSLTSPATTENFTNDPGPLRIFKGTLPYPGLVVTRSLGDNVAHRLGVISDPEITVHEIDAPHLFTPHEAESAVVSEMPYLLVASDGLWDSLSPSDVADVIKNISTRNADYVGAGTSDDSACSITIEDRAKTAVRELVVAALRGQTRRNIEDNVSAVGVFIDHM